MKKTIAIVTGAAGGIGAEFVQVLDKEPIDEIWIVGRSGDRLEKLKRQYGDKLVPVCVDLTDEHQLSSINAMLKRGDFCISYLVNNAGTAHMMASMDFDRTEVEKTICLNCYVPAALINDCMPYMKKGSKIINLSSASAFQPVPFLNLYAATKAFVFNYSHALNVELKSKGITVTAVSPGWVDTDMLVREINGKRIRFYGMVSPRRVARQAIKDAKRGKDVSICSLYVKCQQLNVKLLPHRLIMRIWMEYIKKYTCS